MAYGLAKNGSVEYLRAQLIRDLILPEWDLTLDGLKNILNSDLGDLLGVFGIKKTGSLRTRRQRLYLHLNHDPKQLKEENLDKMTKDDLHALCKALELPRSGNRQTLLIRVAGVLSAQHKNWGQSNGRSREVEGQSRFQHLYDADQEEIETAASIEEEVESFVTEHPEGWTFEDESELMESMDSGGIDTSLSEVAGFYRRDMAPIEKKLSNLCLQCCRNYLPKSPRWKKRQPCWKYPLEEQKLKRQLETIFW